MSNEPIFAFVLMPFAADFDDVYKIGIKETAESLGIRAERVDEQIYSEGMLARIYNQIDAADVIIADMTGRNTNVFYEVGYAHAKNKLCIHLTQDTGDIPFDLQHQRHIVYGTSIKTLRAKLEENLEWVKAEVTNYRNSLIRVKTREITGDLASTQYFVTGNLSFRIDLFNDAPEKSQEIESLYLYAGKNWKLFQSDVECERDESDIEGFKYRYFLKAPQNKISRSSWMPVRFTASRQLASSFDGSPFNESYPVSGYAILRIGTADGVFDHEISIDVNCTSEGIPF